ncbi:MAG: serine protein kinase RIO [Candidatus Hydrothermarchaeaceae archaeon]
MTEFSKLDKKIDRIRKKVRGLDERKIEGKVFDERTLLSLYTLANRGFVDVLYGSIKTGKESCVFAGLGRRGEPLAVKIHNIGTSDYKAKLKYIYRDYRYNLRTARECGVSVPEPIAYRNNIIIMEFVGEDGVPAPALRKYDLKAPRRMFNRIVEEIKKMYRCSLVHSDLSEYNILVRKDEPVLIDLSQSVVTSHPYAQEFLRRDIANICKFFRRYMHTEEDKVLKKVKAWSM